MTMRVRFAAAGVSGFIYGHEFAGVDDRGQGWFVEPTVYGGECAQCQLGNTPAVHRAGSRQLGVFSDGGMAERALVPEYTLLRLPEGLECGEPAGDYDVVIDAAGAGQVSNVPPKPPAPAAASSAPAPTARTHQFQAC